MNARRIRVLIAEDHGTVRDGLRLLLGGEPDIEVVGEAADGREALRLAKELAPDVVLMDVSMPGVDGLRATRLLREACPPVKVLALTRHEDRGFMTEMLRAGASGYALKLGSSAELLQGVRAVAAGQRYLDPRVTARAVEGFAGRRAPDETGESLSGREEEVLRLLALGHTNKEIAARLAVSVKTVEAHKANAMRKLGLSDRAAVVSYAIFRGWMKND